MDGGHSPFDSHRSAKEREKAKESATHHIGRIADGFRRRIDRLGYKLGMRLSRFARLHCERTLSRETNESFAHFSTSLPNLKLA